MINILQKIVFGFWLAFYIIKALPELIPLYIEREYLYLKLMIQDLFYED